MMNNNELYQRLNYIKETDNEVYLDPMIVDSIKLIIESGQVSTSFLQSYFKLGYSRAARLIDQIEELGIIGPYSGAKPRKILMTNDQYIAKYGDSYSSLEAAVKGMSLSQKSCFLAINENGESKEEGALTNNTDGIISGKMKTKASSASAYYKDRLGIDVDWSNDGYFIDKLDNYIFPRANDDIQIKFVREIITYSSPCKIRLLLIEESAICFNSFQGAPHLLLPVISDLRKIKGAFGWLCSETEKRYRIFADKKVQNVFEYNNLIANMSDKSLITEMPHIILIINEAYSFLNDSNISDSLTTLLLKSKKAGINVYLFSRFTQKSLSLGAKADLIKTGDPTDLERIFLKPLEGSHNTTVEDIDNSMKGYEFEEFCGGLLHKNGFTNIRVTQSSGDFGVDIIAYKEEIKYAIQCKKYNSPVGIDAVQQVLGSKTMFNCHVGVVLTNNFFTPAATELAEKNNILLWDRSKLINLMEAAK